MLYVGVAGSEGVAAPWLASELTAAEAERTRFFVAQRGPMGFYGFEAMALILDAIAAGDGHTTSTAYGRLAVADGELVWDR